jgi:hypothetical protein
LAVILRYLSEKVKNYMVLFWRSPQLGSFRWSSGGIFILAGLGCLLIGEKFLTPPPFPVLTLHTSAETKIAKNTVRSLHTNVIHGQQLRIPVRYLSGISFEVHPLLPPPDTIVNLTVTSVDSGKVIATVHRPLSELYVGGELFFPIILPRLSRGELVQFELAASHISKKQPLHLRYEIASEIYEDGTSLINGKEAQGDLGVRLWGSTSLARWLWQWSQQEHHGAYLLGLGISIGAALILLVVPNKIISVQPPQRPPRFWLLPIMAVLLTTIVVVYAPVAHTFFVQDDFALLSRVQQLLARNPLLLFTNVGYIGVSTSHHFMPFYRPLSQGVALGSSYLLFGYHPLGYHLVQLSLHGLAAVAFYAATFQVLRNRRIAFLAALLWALHPLQFSLVSWISAMQEPLAALFFFSALTFYSLFLSSGRWHYYGLSLLLSLTAPLAKETAFLLPAALLGADFLATRQLNIRHAWFSRLVRLAPFLIIIGCIILLRNYAIYSVDSSQAELDVSYRYTANLSVVFENFGAYLIRSFVGSDFATQVSSTQQHLITGGFILATLVLLFAKKSPPAVKAIVFYSGTLFLSTLIPVLGVNSLEGRSDRWLYLPLAGIAIIIAGIWEAILGLGPWRLYRPLLFGVTILCVIIAGHHYVSVHFPQSDLCSKSYYLKHVLADVQKHHPSLVPETRLVLDNLEKDWWGGLGAAPFRFFYNDPTLQISPAPLKGESSNSIHHVVPSHTFPCHYFI